MILFVTTYIIAALYVSAIVYHYPPCVELRRELRKSNILMNKTAYIITVPFLNIFIALFFSMYILVSLPYLIRKIRLFASLKKLKKQNIQLYIYYRDMYLKMTKK